jgi:hypothetical protein
MTRPWVSLCHWQPGDDQRQRRQEQRHRRVGGGVALALGVVALRAEARAPLQIHRLRRGRCPAARLLPLDRRIAHVTARHFYPTLINSTVSGAANEYTRIACEGRWNGIRWKHWAGCGD